MIEYIWKIEALDYDISAKSQTNVITKVHWSLTGNDGKFSSNMSDSWAINFDEKESFTAYDDLTEATVLKWLETSMDDEYVAWLKETIANKIENQANPKTGSGLPWNPSC
jgi:hypothetical protein